MSIPKAYYITLRFGTVKALAGWLAREAEGLVDQAFRRVTQVSARSQPGGLGPCSALAAVRQERGTRRGIGS
jgi:hypothetical protein